jgi:hypothetical protein
MYQVRRSMFLHPHLRDHLKLRQIFLRCHCRGLKNLVERGHVVHESDTLAIVAIVEILERDLPCRPNLLTTARKEQTIYQIHSCRQEGIFSCHDISARCTKDTAK